jgi:hypothetical protein
MSIPIPVPRLGAGHDLLNAVGLLVPIFDIGKEASFLLPDNLKTHYCLLNGSQLKHNNLVAVLHTNVDGSFCVNFVGQVTMIGPDFVSFYHVTATHNPTIPITFRSPIVGASNVLFVVAHTLGVEWAVDNSGGGQLFNFKDGDATVVEAALEVKTASIVSVSSVSSTALLSAADTAKQHGFLKKTLFDDRVRFDELVIANCPLGRQLTAAVIDGLDADSDMHNRFVLYPAVLQKYILLEIAKGSSNLHPPLTPQAKFEGPVDLLWLSNSFEITAPVEHSMVKDALYNLWRILDSACGPRGIDAGLGKGYYEMIASKFMSFFEERNKKNIFSQSPIFVAKIAQELVAELQDKAVTLIPPTERSIKDRLIAIFAKYSYDFILVSYGSWCSEFSLNHMEWLRKLDSDPVLQSRVKRDSSLVLSAPVISSSSGVVASTTIHPAPKKPRKGRVVVSKTGSSSAPVIASGGGGGAVASSVSSVNSRTIAPGSLPSSGKKLCLHHLKYLFLGGAHGCIKGQQCKYVHQRGVKSTRKSDLLDFVQDAVRNDALLVQLVAAINLKA